jgi:SAM-dependent methyltransferase
VSGKPGMTPFSIDRPNPPQIEYPFEQFYGWIGTPDTGLPIAASVAGFLFPAARIERPDLAGRPHIGFSFFLDLPEMVAGGWEPNSTVDLRIQQGASVIGEATLLVSKHACAPCAEIITERSHKAAFVERNCRVPLKKLLGCRAPSALPSDWSISPRVEDKADPVSSHFYGKIIRDFLHSLAADAMVLDAGAGLRRLPAPNVVNMDIYDYPSTDVLGIGQDLPFRDDSFDAALSIAVLEHVNDPFLCAKELIRVVKPGGKIFTIIPFLQAEHGYPSHYFNATRFGVRELFKDGTELEVHFLERSNQPVFTVNQILGRYSAGLPRSTRAAFLEMKIGDFLAKAPDHYIDHKHPIVEDLAEDVRWQLASGTTAIFKVL